MKLDVLVFAAHPDDAELSCGGTILSLVASGKKVGIVDLTEGEMGTRGSVSLRYKEAVAAGRILGRGSLSRQCPGWSPYGRGADFAGGHHLSR